MYANNPVTLKLVFFLIVLLCPFPWMKHPIMFPWFKKKKKKAQNQTILLVKKKPFPFPVLSQAFGNNPTSSTRPLLPARNGAKPPGTAFPEPGAASPSQNLSGCRGEGMPKSHSLQNPRTLHPWARRAPPAALGGWGGGGGRTGVEIGGNPKPGQALELPQWCSGVSGVWLGWLRGARKALINICAQIRAVGKITGTRLSAWSWPEDFLVENDNSSKASFSKGATQKHGPCLPGVCFEWEMGG